MSEPYREAPLAVSTYKEFDAFMKDQREDLASSFLRDREPLDRKCNPGLRKLTMEKQQVAQLLKNQTGVG